jgi:lipoyl(octanoyl) transferase
MEAVWLGRVPYAEALALQERLVDARRRGEAPDTLLLLEHPPVITLGRSSRPGHVLLPPDALAARGIETFDAGRGGDVTYHGPGQLVGYPIVALAPNRRDARRYLRDLEEVLLRTAADHGVRGRREAGLTGVWVGGRKLAAIGVRISTGWITSHGFALNVSADLGGFDAIVPCGIRGRGVTSLEAEAGKTLAVREVADRAAVHAADVLGLPLAGREASRISSPA